MDKKEHLAAIRTGVGMLKRPIWWTTLRKSGQIWRIWDFTTFWGFGSLLGLGRFEAYVTSWWEFLSIKLERVDIEIDTVGGPISTVP